MAKILVTGGLGYIGSHTCVSLQESGHEVVILDNLYNSRIEVLDKIEAITSHRPVFYQCDILDVPALEQVFVDESKQAPIDAVIHFAALKAVGESVEKPLFYYENNLTGTLNLLKVMEKYQCKKIVFSSSATVYGEVNPVPYTEDMPTSATNPYGYTKVACERFMLDMASVDSSLSVGILRYFNPIGAHPSGLIGENPNGIPNNLLPYIMQVAVGKLDQLRVFGDDYDTPDGTGVRDYIHVVDLAVGHVSALEYLMKEQGVLMVNLGTGVGSSVLDVVKSAENAIGKPIPLKIFPRRAGDLPTSYANTYKAKELLGFTAKYTLDEMCAHSWHFMETSKHED